MAGWKLMKAVTRRTPVGTRIVVQANPVSRVMYAYLPPNGTAGTVTTVSLGAGQRSFLPGPGGGLLYVKFDDGHFQGISPTDLRLEPK